VDARAIAANVHARQEPALSHVPGHLPEETAPEDDDALSDEHKAARAEFWRKVEERSCWSVPMGREESLMPWLARSATGLTEAIRRARERGKTVLLVDNSRDRVVDTFYRYRHAQVIETKKMVLDENRGARTRGQIMEDLRQRLVCAMRYGQTLYFRMSNTACNIVSKYSSEVQLPLALFDHAVVQQLDLYTGERGENLHCSAHPLARVLRQEDTEGGHGVFRVCRSPRPAAPALSHGPAATSGERGDLM